jgi:hypothetical protein
MRSCLLVRPHSFARRPGRVRRSASAVSGGPFSPPLVDGRALGLDYSVYLREASGPPRIRSASSTKAFQAGLRRRPCTSMTWPLRQPLDALGLIVQRPPLQDAEPVLHEKDEEQGSISPGNILLCA